MEPTWNPQIRQKDTSTGCLGRKGVTTYALYIGSIDRSSRISNLRLTNETGHGHGQGMVDMHLCSSFSTGVGGLSATGTRLWSESGV
jgi:hypothetical protein